MIREYDVKMKYSAEKRRMLYALNRPYEFKVKDEIITVPEGFVTDWASVPRWAWSFVNSTGKMCDASLLHDYLYDNKGIGKWDRDEVDDIFRCMLIEDGIRKHQADIMYYMVHWFGEKWWRNEE